MTLRQRQPREKNKKHLEFVSRLPCIITGRGPVQVCHIRFPSIAHDKRQTGKGEKPDDRWVLPMTPEMHALQHSGNEQKFWEGHGIDPLATAQLLYACSGDIQEGLKVIRLARRTGAKT
jgi:hypothetical protein